MEHGKVWGQDMDFDKWLCRALTFSDISFDFDSIQKAYVSNNKKIKKKGDPVCMVLFPLLFHLGYNNRRMKRKKEKEQKK